MGQTLVRRGEGRRKGIAPSPEVLIVAVWLSLGCWGWFTFGSIWIAAFRPAPDRYTDFYQDWGSARNHRVGLPVYTSHATSIPRHLGIPFDRSNGIEYNAHPPTSVLLALPLASLDYPDAVLAWNAIALAAFLVSLVIVAVVLPAPRTLFLPFLAALALCHPLYGSLYLAQHTPILVLLVSTIWALERSGRSGAAGLLLGVAASIKLFPAYLVVYYAAQGRIRPVVAAAASFLALTLVTVLVLGPDAYFDYVRIVLPGQGKFRSLGYNLAIAGLWHKLFDPFGENGLVEPLWLSPALARWGTWLSDLAITAILATFVRRARTPAQRDLAFASTVTAMLLVSPVTWDFSLPLLLVPIAVIAHHTGNSRWMPAALMLILVVVWLPQILWTKLALGGQTLTLAPWTFMLGAPSFKSYALLGTFALGLAAFKTAGDPLTGLMKCRPRGGFQFIPVSSRVSPPCEGEVRGGGPGQTRAWYSVRHGSNLRNCPSVRGVGYALFTPPAPPSQGGERSFVISII